MVVGISIDENGHPRICMSFVGNLTRKSQENGQAKNLKLTSAKSSSNNLTGRHGTLKQLNIQLAVESGLPCVYPWIWFPYSSANCDLTLKSATMAEVYNINGAVMTFSYS
jgi:hypothetical protein